MSGNTGYSTGSIAIAVCDRCGRLGQYRQMVEDYAKKGVWVHAACADHLSPWQLPMQVQDNYVLMRPRPDSQLTYNTYNVNDQSPVIIATAVNQYPNWSFAKGTTYQTASVILDSSNSEAIQSGPDSPQANQQLNSNVTPTSPYAPYVPPSLRRR